MHIKDLLKIDPSSIDLNNPEGIKVCFEHLCNLIEALYKENRELKRENQKLKDEINRLKGEKGKPDIKANSSKKSKEENSLSKATKQKKKWLQA
jgi:cell division septum initiation protein DivIVA